MIDKHVPAKVEPRGEEAWNEQKRIMEQLKVALLPLVMNASVQREDVEGVVALLEPLVSQVLDSNSGVVQEKIQSSEGKDHAFAVSFGDASSGKIMWERDSEKGKLRRFKLEGISFRELGIEFDARALEFINVNGNTVSKSDMEGIDLLLSAQINFNENGKASYPLYVYVLANGVDEKITIDLSEGEGGPLATVPMFTKKGVLPLALLPSRVREKVERVQFSGSCSDFLKIELSIFPNLKEVGRLPLEDIKGKIALVSRGLNKGKFFRLDTPGDISIYAEPGKQNGEPVVVFDPEGEEVGPDSLGVGTQVLLDGGRAKG